MAKFTRFQVDPRLATLLGEGYRSSEQALKELVDNAWDADAENVHITLPESFSGDPIIITDDGSGMSLKAVQDEYLVVAKDRRIRSGERTPRKSRLVKGRKGIGKFAGLMAAHSMIVKTISKGTQTQLQIRKRDLEMAGKDLEGIDLPIETTSCPSEEHGTTIVLEDLNQSLSVPQADRLRQILFLEYGRRSDFAISVNGQRTDIEDIPGETYQDKKPIEGAGDVDFRFTISDTRAPLKYSGIAVRVGGKVVGRTSYLGLEQDDDIPGRLLKRVYGEIEADGLADDVTADWGAIVENSVAYSRVREFASERLRAALTEKLHRDVGTAKSRWDRETAARLEQLPEYRRASASRALERIFQKFYGDSDERIDTLIQVVLEAYEQDEYASALHRVESAKSSDAATFTAAVGEFGAMDNALNARQAQNRLALLENLLGLAWNPETPESTMRAAFEKNLWILGPEYGLMSSNPTLTATIDQYADGKGAQRPDLLLCTNYRSETLLIEFKKPIQPLTKEDAVQADIYSQELSSRFPDIEILLLGGERKATPRSDREDIELLSYEAVIVQAQAELRWLLGSLSS